ncbi:ubiquitin-like domain-containing protein [Planococcus lenghuensis]|uniref:DUF348 domain-containing protein n=1 Tax=Planococcus lenghuensis TaxID=2213202 RepID=A0A1Q2KU47_9BACL|nr:ubiquitin-like domain-containing protein [Planococcus lenghuensis]AQQ51709.1 hypothetical protein B0X71_00195 [Planococcus lenghuensis]
MFINFNRRSVISSKQKKKIGSIIVLVLLLLGAMTALMVNENSKNTITFTANGQTEQVQTHAKTVNAFLKEQNVDFGEHDYIFPSVNQSIHGDMAIEWAQAEQYAISLEDKKITAWATSNRVKDILEKADVTLSEHERVTPGLSEKAQAHIPITIESIEANVDQQAAGRHESASAN